MRSLLLGLVTTLFAITTAAPTLAQGPPVDMAARLETMAQLALLDGRWEGEGWHAEPGSAERRSFRQTERVGPLLDGQIRLIEGRGYDAKGARLFNAFAVLSPDGAGGYDLRSYAQGRVGTFKARLRAPGVMEWTIPAGPTRIVYLITVKDGVWEEVGDFIDADGKANRFFSMRLRRTADASWPNPIASGRDAEPSSGDGASRRS